MLRKLTCPTLHECNQTPLRGAIGLQTRALSTRGLNPLRRADEHDRSAAGALDERGYRGVDGVPRADEIDIDDVAEGAVPIIGVGDPDDPGIGDDDVEPAEGLQSLLEHRCNGITVANVALPGQDSAATVLDQLHCGGQVIRGCAGVVGRLELCADVDRDDGGTLGGEPDRVRAPHSACGPGDERNLAAE